MTDPFVQIMRNIEDTIARVGWNVMGVGGSPTSEPFYYTIGLKQSYDHPELLLTGPWPPSLAQGLLNTLGEKVKGGERLNEGWYSGVINNWSVPLRSVRAEMIQQNFGAANRYYRERGETFTAFQMFLPDRFGRFPDDAGADEDFHSRQPNWSVGPVTSRVLN